MFLNNFHYLPKFDLPTSRVVIEHTAIHMCSTLLHLPWGEPLVQAYVYRNMLNLCEISILMAVTLKISVFWGCDAK
jgi:hypothetical protein